MNELEIDTDNSEKNWLELSMYFSLFSHSNRLATFLEIAKHGGSVEGYLIPVNSLHDSTIKNNLALLKKHQILTGKLRSNQNLFYQINYKELDRFKAQFDEFYKLASGEVFIEEPKKETAMYPHVKKYLEELIPQFDSISEERKTILKKIGNYISEKRTQDKPAHLVYICTHNSRRSHFGQIWAKVAADFYGIPNVHTYSGGTEATAFNPNAIEAVKRAGMKVQKTTDTENPVYHVYHAENQEPSVCFSKAYDASQNPMSEFAAIMTCSDAEENCPFIPGVELRIGTTYDDPKAFDNSPLQDEKYDERCRQIALETLYAFSTIQ